MVITYLEHKSFSLISISGYCLVAVSVACVWGPSYGEAIIIMVILPGGSHSCSIWCSSTHPSCEGISYFLMRAQEGSTLLVYLLVARMMFKAKSNHLHQRLVNFLNNGRPHWAHTQHHGLCRFHRPLPIPHPPTVPPKFNRRVIKETILLASLSSQDMSRPSSSKMNSLT